jgi:hypothetical protein
METKKVPKKLLSLASLLLLNFRPKHVPRKWLTIGLTRRRSGVRESHNPAFLIFDNSQLLGAGCHLTDVLDSRTPPL